MLMFVKTNPPSCLLFFFYLNRILNADFKKKYNTFFHIWKIRAKVNSTLILYIFLSKWGSVIIWNLKCLFYIIFTKRNNHRCTTVRMTDQVKHINVYSASYSCQLFTLFVEKKRKCHLKYLLKFLWGQINKQHFFDEFFGQV